MEIISVIGYAAGTLTTIALIPQVVRTWKTKSAGDLSLGMCITFCLGVLLWLIYGIILNSMPIIIANAAVFPQALVILILKIRYPV